MDINNPSAEIFDVSLSCYLQQLGLKTNYTLFSIRDRMVLILKMSKVYALRKIISVKTIQSNIETIMQCSSIASTVSNLVSLGL